MLTFSEGTHIKYEPMIDYTLDDLTEFTRVERQMLNDIFKQDQMIQSKDRLFVPKEDSVNRIMAYSKALSVKKSRSLDTILVVLN
ncbi:MAG: hypothetical protein ACI84C_000950 [Flavobacteriales bacterium]|jgi:hypothetical protein